MRKEATCCEESQVVAMRGVNLEIWRKRRRVLRVVALAGRLPPRFRQAEEPLDVAFFSSPAPVSAQLLPAFLLLSANRRVAMSWFGFGGSKAPEPDRSTEAPMRIDDFDTSGFAAPSPSSSSASDFGSASGNNFQEQLMMAQQTLMMQALVLKLTETAFERCVPKPSTSLSYSESNCISATVGKYIDSSRLILKRFEDAQNGAN